MSKGIQKKIEELRQQPESVRIRAAAMFTAVGGAALLMIWMFIILPLELRSKNNQSAQSTPNPTVAGTTAPITPTINPALYAPSPTPVVTQVFQPLPSSSPVDSSSLPVATAQPN